MKILRVLAILKLAVLCVLLAGPSKAGPFGGGFGGRRAQAMQGQVMARLAEALDLTADQQARIKPIVEDAMTRFRALPEADRKARSAEVLTGAFAQIRPILSVEQRQRIVNFLGELQQRVAK